jgi:hypothetical protein
MSLAAPPRPVAACLADSREDLLVGWVAAGGELGIDLAAVDDDLERPAIRIDELDVTVFVPFFQGIRQTDGFWTIVSDDAVFDGDSHGDSFGVD